MAPIKVPKKPLQTMEKPLEKKISKMKKKKKNYQTFSIYIYKVLRSVMNDRNTPMGISRKSLAIMNNFVNDMLEKIATEAGRLVAHGKKTTLSSWDVQGALQLLLPGELANHAKMEALKAITLYQKSKSQEMQ